MQRCRALTRSPAASVIPARDASAMMFERILVTGGAGFIGSALCRHLIAHTSASVLNIDKLSYAGNLMSLRAVSDHPRHRFAQANICDADVLERLLAEFRPDAVMHLAAETHVDRSIGSAREFIDANVLGTFTLLEGGRKYWSNLPGAARNRFRFLQVSTDEVYGSVENGLSTEDSPYNPSSP